MNWVILASGQKTSNDCWWASCICRACCSPRTGESITSWKHRSLPERYHLRIKSTWLISCHLLSLMETELTSLCQSVLEDFNLVLFYLPLPAHGSQSASEEEEEHDSVCSVLPDSLIFKMVVTCLMVVHSLKRGGKCGPKELITTSAAHLTQCHYSH